ncbi:alpha/beta hydrolase [Paractinoplanes ferrugineus]|uniref:Alpha/beta hydrolase n=1 Tax=Paractinoplanes ferrugineus TaxID=113564 RepID=A0A919J525_9ACTN|nr:alpha/beta fold hydrolase [Actinoplanes ferrugineus]GIE13153.1 alpha/beta hydrolase [Actinoplanes ferrugineus]
MTVRARVKVRFSSGSDECVAYHYPGTNGACVVMGPGGGITKEPGTDRFATRFHRAGYSVLAFDHRHWGESGGTPRQVIRVGSQLADWKAAVRTAARLPEVDATRIALWGFSLSGGHVVKVAADRALGVAAVIAQTPFSDGLALFPNALRHETLGVVARFPLIAAGDLLRGALGREPRLIPLAGPKGTVAMLTTPDAQLGDRALDPDGAYPDWTRSVAARSVLPLGSYRPTRSARKLTAPLLVVVARADQTNLPGPAVKMARRAPRHELLELSGHHYAPFLDEHDTVVAAELDFLERHLST